MNYSYWENKQWFNGNDFTIVGSGIVGLTCAISLREKHPNSKIIILEKGVLPQGASTKNAGFACFGSVSELLSDLKTHSTQEVVQLVSSRWQGLKMLRRFVGDKNLDYQHNFGFELFLDGNSYEESVNKIYEINELLIPLFGENVFNVSVNGISGVIEIPTGFYVGSTLAEALQNRINQIQDPVTGDTVGGVTVKYKA